MQHLLLIGAGFSRNWGGWLASEAFEYLLGAPEIDAGLAQLLWKHKASGGFESALAELQAEAATSSSAPTRQRLEKLQNAVIQMFRDMDRAFAGMQFEPQQDRRYQLGPFLTRFDAIFSLNQDLLLERHYLNDNVSLNSNGKWSGYQVPGMTRTSTAAGLSDVMQEKWSPVDPSQFRVDRGQQPLFKLHGSTTWVASNNGQMLVIGGNKRGTISQQPVLK